MAQFKYTVLLMPNGPDKITGLPFDPSLYKSDKSITDQEILVRKLTTSERKLFSISYFYIFIVSIRSFLSSQDKVTQTNLYLINLNEY